MAFQRAKKGGRHSRKSEHRNHSTLRGPSLRIKALDAAIVAIAEPSIGGAQGADMVVVENTPQRQNLVVCTLCPCYPWPVLGLPPGWLSGMHDRGGEIGAAEQAIRTAARRPSIAMNEIHDLSGMRGFGTIDPEPDEPVFPDSNALHQGPRPPERLHCRLQGPGNLGPRGTGARCGGGRPLGRRPGAGMNAISGLGMPMGDSHG